MVTAAVTPGSFAPTRASHRDRCDGDGAQGGAVTLNTAGSFNWCHRAGASGCCSFHQRCACMHAKPADTVTRQHQHNRFMGLGVTAGIWPPSRITPGTQRKAPTKSHGKSTHNGQNGAKTGKINTSADAGLHVTDRAPIVTCRRCGHADASWLCRRCTVALWPLGARLRWGWARLAYRLAKWWWSL